MWALLLITLPTQPNAVRLRVWRGLKALGSVPIRDGAYVLPARHAHRFEALAAEVLEHGGTATVLDLSPRDETQRQEIVALFDRSEAYASWRAGHQDLISTLSALSEVEARRKFRALADALAALIDIDYYPGAAAEQARADLDSLRATLDARYSKGEPRAQPPAGIERLDVRRFQGKRWATRERPWVDRLACAWLIRRFVDSQARFLWLPDPAGTTPPPRGTLGFDFDSARFTHVGGRVTFEVLAASFGLDADPRLLRLAQAVHYLDVGGIPAPEAPGLEQILGGLREIHVDDDALLAAASQVFDALYAAPGTA
jgi:hypothetical protein